MNSCALETGKTASEENRIFNKLKRHGSNNEHHTLSPDFGLFLPFSFELSWTRKIPMFRQDEVYQLVLSRPAARRELESGSDELHNLVSRERTVKVVGYFRKSCLVLGKLGDRIWILVWSEALQIFWSWLMAL